MKNIETLTENRFGQYNTRKKLNLSNKTIPAVLVERLENSEFTFEMIQELSKTFPILKYKTCITIHGIFNLDYIPRIGGYKNVIQNKNKSVEIRYNAIDLDKKQLIAENLRIVKTGFRFLLDSQGAYFEKAVRVKTQTDITENRAKFESIQASLTQVDFYGKTSIYRAQDFMSNHYLVLDVFMDCIPQASVNDLFLTLAGCSQSEFDVLETAYNETARLEKIESDKREVEQQIKRDKQNALRDAKINQIAHLTKFNIEVNSIGVKDAIARNCIACFKFVRIVKKGGFGRVKYQWQVCKELIEFDTNKFRDAKKEVKVSDFASYRQFNA